MRHKPYRQLLFMAALHFAAMYVLMYAMVNVFANVLPNYNQFYMAALMTSPMILIELWLMRGMYPKAHINIIIAVVAAIIFASSYLFIRLQTGINDEQFLKSMIPHHAGAILMCEQAAIEDEQVRELCANIIKGQQAEIDWMKAKLQSLGG